MPLVHRIAFNDNFEQVKTASGLLNAHVGVVVLAAIAALCQLIIYIVTRGPVNEYNEAVRPEEARWERSGGFWVGGLGQFASIVIFVGLPIVAYFFARKGLAENSGSLLQGICLIDGSCTYCAFLSSIVAIQAMIVWSHRSSQVDDVMCGRAGWTSSDGEFHQHEDYTQAKCESTKKAMADLRSPALAMYAILMIIDLFLACTCAYGTFQANNAHRTVKQGKCFVGAPPAPVMITTTGQPNATVVIGQPVVGTPIHTNPC